MPPQRRRPPRPQMPRPPGPLGPNEWRQVERRPGQRLTSVTVRVDSEILLVARMRALLEGTNVSRLVRTMLAEYAAEATRRFRSDPPLQGFGARRADG